MARFIQENTDSKLLLSLKSLIREVIVEMVSEGNLGLSESSVGRNTKDIKLVASKSFEYAGKYNCRNVVRINEVTKNND